MFLVLGMAHSKALGHSTLEELEGRQCVRIEDFSGRTGSDGGWWVGGSILDHTGF